MMRGRYRALALLTLYGIKGRIRHIGRAFRTVRGVIAFLFGFVMFASWMSMSLIGFLSNSNPSAGAELFERVPFEVVQVYIALLLLGYCLITFFFQKQGAGVHFKPAEVDFLFGGPYDRRELLLYKILGLFSSAVISSLIFSIVLSWTPVPWPILFMGLALAISFAILLNVLSSIGALALATRMHGRIMRIAVGIVTAALLAGIYTAIGTSDFINATERGLEIAQSPVGQVVLWPFMVFARALTALDYLSFARHAVFAVGINAILIAGILMLDADYYESSIDVARKNYDRLRRMRDGDFWGTTGKRTSSWSLPELPRLAGVGPIAWRQATSALRGLPRVLLLLGVITIPGAAIFMTGHREGVLRWVLGYLAAMAFIFIPSALRFDFRADLQKMSWLKALPVASWAVVLGQLLPAVCVLIGFETLVIVVIATSANSWFYIGALPVVPPAAFIMFAIENAIFLFFPTRRFAMYPGDFQTLGHTYIVALAKILVFAVVFGSAAAIGAALHYLLLVPLPAVSFFLAAYLTIVAVPFIPLLCYAFDRFDPSTDVPLD